MGRMIKNGINYSIGGGVIGVDPTLTIEDMAGDSKAIGDAITTRCNSNGYLEIKVNGIWEQTDILVYSQIEYVIEKGVITGKFGGLATHAYQAVNAAGYAYAPTITQKTDYIEIKSVNTSAVYGGSGIVSTKEKIDITQYSTLTVDVKKFNRVGASAIARILLSNELKEGFVPVTNTLIDSDGIYTVDLSSVNSECYITILMWCDVNETLTVNVSDIWLE